MHLIARATRSTLSVLVGLVVAGSALPADAVVTVGPSPSNGVEVPTRTSASPGQADQVSTVVAVSIDALQSRAIRKLGPERTPVLHRLISEGASTLNARTARELTDTLPNHTSMVTGRRIGAARGGHGVTWNDERREPSTVHEAAREPVSSVFGAVAKSGASTALFAGKAKFGLFERSWDDALDRFTVSERNDRLVRRVEADLREHSRAFRFVHLSRPDVVGHRHGFSSSAYLAAVERADALLGRIVATIEAAPASDRAVLIVTADHGGSRSSHRDPTEVSNYRIPFLVWGAGVAQGADLYALNPDYADPGSRRTTYATEPPPVRNGDLANLVTDLLGLGPVAGSEINAGQALGTR